MKSMTKAKRFKHEELSTALHATQDLMERLAGCQFFPLGEVYIGIREAEFTKSRQSMFRTLSEFLGYKIEEAKDGYKIELKGVPIHIKIIKRDYKFFDNPNITFWGVTEFLMPNPFEEYWKVRGLIK